MKKFDRYSIRGIIFTLIGIAGIGYEILSSRPSEWLVIILYGVVIFIGMLLLLYIKEYEH